MIQISGKGVTLTYVQEIAPKISSPCCVSSAESPDPCKQALENPPNRPHPWGPKRHHDPTMIPVRSREIHYQITGISGNLPVSPG